MQIVHSTELDSDGNALDSNSFYAKFMSKLRDDWDIVDEGPMADLLGIDCDKMADGSILLHQGRYIRKLLTRFAPNGPKYKHTAVPYSSDLPRLVIEAYEGSSANAPAYPELIKPYQQRVGALMYACTGTRPDLAYAVHQHCRVLSRPTPEYWPFSGAEILGSRKAFLAPSGALQPDYHPAGGFPTKMLAQDQCKWTPALENTHVNFCSSSSSTARNTGVCSGC